MNKIRYDSSMKKGKVILKNDFRSPKKQMKNLEKFQLQSEYNNKGDKSMLCVS